MPDRFREQNKSTFDLLPFYYRSLDADPGDGAGEKLLSAFDSELRQWDQQLDDLRDLRCPWRSTESQINYRFAEMGVSPPAFLSLTKKREILSRLVYFLKRKGNVNAVRDLAILASGLGINAVSQWSSDTHWKMGVSSFGVETYIGPSYRQRGEYAWVIGNGSFGTDSKITHDYTNQRMVYTVNLYVTRSLTLEERQAIEWAVALLARGVDHYVIIEPVLQKYWIVGYSKVAVDTKVRADCWKFGVSLFGLTSVICGSTVIPPDPCVLPSTTGTWVPWKSGGSFYPYLGYVP